MPAPEAPLSDFEIRQEIEARQEALAPPVISEPRCLTCMSEYRAYIEQQLVKGISYITIAKTIPRKPEINENQHIDSWRRSIKKHYVSHMKINDAVIRAELEEAANLLGQNIEEGLKGALTDRGMLKVMARKAYEDIVNGVTTVEPRDLIQIVKLLNDLEVDNAAVQIEESQNVVRIFSRAIRNVCDDDTVAKIVEEVKRLRKQDNIESEMEGIIPPRRVGLPEAEVVE